MASVRVLSGFIRVSWATSSQHAINDCIHAIHGFIRVTWGQQSAGVHTRGWSSDPGSHIADHGIDRVLTIAELLEHRLNVRAVFPSPTGREEAERVSWRHGRGSDEAIIGLRARIERRRGDQV